MNKLITLLFLIAAPIAVSAQGLDDCSGPQYAAIDFTSSGDNTVVAAVTGKKIRLLGYVLTALADVSVRWESGAGGTALSGAMYIGPGETNQVLAPSCGSYGCLETAAGELLNLEMGGATQVDGHAVYSLCN